LKSGSLNLLEPSGPVQTCNGIALPLYDVLFGLVSKEDLEPFTGYMRRIIFVKENLVFLEVKL